MKRLTVLMLITVLACGKKKPSDPAPATTGSDLGSNPGSAPPPPVPTPTATGSATPAHDEDDLLGIASGAMIVAGAGVEAMAEAWYMLDEDPATGWSQESEKVAVTPLVIALPDRVQIETIVLDEAQIELDLRLATEIQVDISDKSETGPWQPIATLKPNMPPVDNVRFPVAAKIPGQWVRITPKGCHCDAKTSMEQIMELRAYGTRLTHNPLPDVTGSYDTDHGTMYLTQTGTSVTGCYELGAAPFVGGVDGHLVKFEWIGKSENERGPGILMFGSGKLFGGYWPVLTEVNPHPKLTAIVGKRTSDKPGPCPTDKKPEDPIVTDLKKTGHARLYGINFDTDSDTIRDDSKPALDHVVAILKADPTLKLRVEGHTDSTSTPEHNQKLSDQRATAVKAYLVTAGIDGARLEAQGLGQTKPIAPNSTSLGRAQNRRVELAKL